MEFCIVGTGRCGTRLLRGMLNAHPDLFVFNETHWIANLYECFGTRPVPVADLIDVVQRTRHVTGAPTTEFDAEAFEAEAALPQTLTPAAFTDALGMYSARQDGKRLWADKTPDYGGMATTLQLYWPETRIIHLIRDGAFVVRSMQRHIGYQALVAHGRQNWCPLSLNYPGFSAPPAAAPSEAFAELWFRRLTRIRNEASRLKPGSYLEVRHEDVLADPGRTLARIADFTGMNPDRDWLEMAGALVDPALSAKPRPAEVLGAFDARHLALMDELGYDTARPGPA